MSDDEREARIAKLRRLVATGEYQINPREVAARIIRSSEKPAEDEPNPRSKSANTAD
jgi:anti-sigma28 factor (negative regulator of flagellin synthesis)